LKEFHNYFPYPIYRDDDLAYFHAFGDRNIFSNITTYNPFKIWAGAKELGKRVKAKGIEGNMVGEGLRTGGLIIFGNDGEAKYMYTENIGEPLEMDDIVAALNAIREGTPVEKSQLVGEL
jgi:hypothetical protein